MSEVNLVSLSKPSAYTECNSANELVAWAARVSNPGNQNNTATAPKLVQYLITNQHWSPLEMVHVSMEIKTTRDIARQILRHRSFSFQEFSQRYADPTKDLGFVTREARLQDAKNRQNSVELGPDENRLAEEWNVMQTQATNAAKMAYNWAIERGIAKQAVMPYLTDIMRKNQTFFRVEELTHGNKKKSDRIVWALQGRFEHGQIKLNKGEWNATFLDQLFQFPNAMVHDDLIDSLSYIEQLSKQAYVSEWEEEEEYEPIDSWAGY